MIVESNKSCLKNSNQSLFTANCYPNYSLVPNRRGVGISEGGLEKSPKNNKRVGWNSLGVGNDATI